MAISQSLPISHEKEISVDEFCIEQIYHQYIFENMSIIFIFARVGTPKVKYSFSWNSRAKPHLSRKTYIKHLRIIVIG